MIKEESYIEELNLFPHTIKVGEKGTGYSKKIQEWLCLHKYHTQGYNISVEIDDWYGKGTASAVKAFQDKVGLEVTGEVDNQTWIALTAPMMRAFKTITFHNSVNIQFRLVAYMEQFLVEHPTELASNKGPWVRAFMKGSEGDWAAWCNGVVSTALYFASNSMNKPMDNWLKWSWSTVKTKNNAIHGLNSEYIPPKDVDGINVEVGDLFLVMKGSTPRHIGVVNRVADGTFSTIEGNTNDEGSRDGYELCERRRNLLNGKYSIIKLK